MILIYYAVRFYMPKGERLRLALQRSGPVFIKLGQALSTGHDVLSNSMIASLSQLRDRVKPVSSKKLLLQLRRSLKRPSQIYLAALSLTHLFLLLLLKYMPQPCCRENLSLSKY